MTVAMVAPEELQQDTKMSITTTEKSTPSTACCGPDCCGGEKQERPADEVTAVVREQYGRTAKSGLSSNDSGVRAVAEAFGYSSDELTSIPAEANMGLSCGNPTATANLRPGEVVVDLGSGGGLDVFLAAQKVGPTGRAIGIDMTPEMIELSKKNAAKSNVTNVEFHLAGIDNIPLPDASVDVVISNCVINLAPDKSAVFREIARVLKPGGRLAVSDIALKQPLPDEIGKDVQAYVGCISGALLIDQYRRQLTEAGFADVVVVDAGANLNAYAAVEGQSGCCSPAMSATETPAASSACCSPAASTVPVTAAASGCCGSKPPADQTTVHEGLAGLLDRYDVNDYAASVKVYAVRPKT
jgi:SAM-dependent methyltransferase